MVDNKEMVGKNGRMEREKKGRKGGLEAGLKDVVGDGGESL